MTDSARDRILARLRSAPRAEAPRPEFPPAPAAPEPPARIDELTTRLEAMRAEVHRVPAAGWVEALTALLRERGWSSLLYAPETEIGRAIEAAVQRDPQGLPELVAYREPVERFKERLFTLEAAVTGAAGAAADAGALILRPDAAEPRLMSLVPPVHIAILEAERIFPRLEEAMQEGRWAEGMPTNMILVSGPSKTADIELTLAFGVHGPKELIVMILEGEG